MCGIVGIVGKENVNQSLYDALTVLQHRGQDAAGMVTFQDERFFLRKDNGLVRDVFRTRHMRRLQGNVGIGHVRYPTAGSSSSMSVAYQGDGQQYHQVCFSQHAIPISNRLCAVQALALLGEDLSSVGLDTCIQRIVVPGRFEVDTKYPKYIFDVAHNLHAATYLIGLLEHERDAGKVICLFSALNNKDIGGILKLLDNRVDHWISWQLDTDRALHAHDMVTVLSENTSKFEFKPTCEEAIVSAEALANETTDTILVLGSFFTVAEVKSLLAQRKEQK